MTDEPEAPVTRADAQRTRRQAQEVERALAELDPGLVTRALAHVEAHTAAALAATEQADMTISSTSLLTAATGVLANPADALVYLDPTALQLDDGSTDDGAVQAALDALVTDRPYLTGAQAQRFRGGNDGGTKGGPPEQRDLSELGMDGYRKARHIGLPTTWG